MKTIDEILDEVTKGDPTNNEMGETFVWRYKAEIAMKEYAKEVLQDYDNWKAHKTPDLVKQYIKEKAL